MFAPDVQSRVTEVFVNTMSPVNSIGGGLRHILGANPASAAWTTANQARYVPFKIMDACLVVKLLAYNGATAAGNTDIGIFTRAGVKILSSGAVAQAGTSNWQAFDVTDTWLNPGQYWFGLLNTTTTGTYFSFTSLPAAKLAGVCSQAVGAGTLPSTATFATMDAAGIIPIIGLSLRVLI
jgi:hypothetical protein